MELDPNAALNYLDNILAGMDGSRKEHVTIQAAVSSIATALAPQPLEDPDAAVSPLGS